jgi:hypothetical protein
MTVCFELVRLMTTTGAPDAPSGEVSECKMMNTAPADEGVRRSTSWVRG